MKRVYIAGKISGLPKEVYTEKFKIAKEALCRCGHEGVSPIDRIDQSAEWGKQIIDCLNILISCDAIYLLNNWEDSPGARIEHEFAKRIGKTIYTEKI